MNLSGLTGEERLLLARLTDLRQISGQKQIARFSLFLNERQLLIAQAFLDQTGEEERCLLWGGYEGATRRMAGFFPDWLEPAGEEFPIAALTLHLPFGCKLTHRDFLGSLMGLGIGRECIGDILPAERHCHLFVTQAVSALVLEEMPKVGRTGVRAVRGLEGELALPEFEERRGTVSSMRLDCVVSMLTGKSRERTADLIRRELVQLNHAPNTNISQQLVCGDTLSIRGYGKYKVDAVGAPTKKGRLPVVCQKFA